MELGKERGVMGSRAGSAKVSKLKQPSVSRAEVVNQDDFRDLASEERLVLSFRTKAQKLALSILRKWHARLPLEELFSVVDLSLCEAARHYRPEKGASFITFLYYHLRGNLIRAVTDAATAHAAPAAQANADGSEERLCTAIDIAESLTSTDFEMPDESLYRKELIRIIREACERLESVEREVIERLFLDEELIMDIAASMGYSRCHVSRIKKAAMENLQEALAGVVAGRSQEELFSGETQDEKRATKRRRSSPRRSTIRELRPKVSKRVLVARETASESVSFSNVA